MKVSMTLLGAGLAGCCLCRRRRRRRTRFFAGWTRSRKAQLDARDKEIAAVRTVADAERRKEVVRRKILAALGGLPDYAGPLNARVTGRIQADGYVIEKVIYESLPGFYVTANLYRPNQPGVTRACCYRPATPRKARQSRNGWRQIWR